MTIDKEKLSEMFLSAAKLLKAKSQYLSEIDSKFGDGDHGITIGKIAALLEQKVSSWGEESIRDFIEKLGKDVMAVNGGSAGPLYGTMLGGLSIPLTTESEIDAELLKKMLESSKNEMMDISNARIGDKTMMDALIPAVDKALESPNDIKIILQNAADAAEKGAKASEQFMSQYGRARSYKEQTIGTPDAGAVSTAILFVGLAQPFLKSTETNSTENL